MNREGSNVDGNLTNFYFATVSFVSKQLKRYKEDAWTSSGGTHQYIEDNIYDEYFSNFCLVRFDDYLFQMMCEMRK